MDRQTYHKALQAVVRAYVPIATTHDLEPFTPHLSDAQRTYIFCQAPEQEGEHGIYFAVPALRIRHAYQVLHLGRQGLRHAFSSRTRASYAEGNECWKNDVFHDVIYQDDAMVY